jgi:hypothetical protein
MKSVRPILVFTQNEDQWSVGQWSCARITWIQLESRKNKLRAPDHV